LNKKAGGAARPGVVEAMRRFRIGGEIVEDDAPALQAALSGAVDFRSELSRVFHREVSHF